MATILIVDDEPEICELIAAQVKHEGHTPVTAANTTEAWELLQKNPDLVFLDVDLPGETGVSLVFRLRESHLCDNTPIVFVTAYPERSGPLQATGMGAVDVITKPFHRNDIVKILKRYLGEGAAPAKG